MNLNYIIQKTHTLKKRKVRKFYKYKKLCWGELGFALTQGMRFELYYLAFFKKFLSRKYFKARTRYRAIFYWILIRPNAILSSLSKNSRMGKGVGLSVRIVQKLQAGAIFLEFRGISQLWVRRWGYWLRFKVPIYYTIL